MGKARGISFTGAPEICLPWVGSGLIYKHLTRLDRIFRENTLAYYEHSYITGVKCLIILSPRANVIKLFMAVNY
jgi:hypothetical protein